MLTNILKHENTYSKTKLEENAKEIFGKDFKYNDENTYCLNDSNGCLIIYQNGSYKKLKIKME